MTTSITHVWLRGARGVTLLALDDFLTLDRELRALLIVEGEVEFLAADGSAVPLFDALQELRESWLPKAQSKAA